MTQNLHEKSEKKNATGGLSREDDRVYWKIIKPSASKSGRGRFKQEVVVYESFNCKRVREVIAHEDSTVAIQPATNYCMVIT